MLSGYADIAHGRLCDQPSRKIETASMRFMRALTDIRYRKFHFVIVVLTTVLINCASDSEVPVVDTTATWQADVDATRTTLIERLEVSTSSGSTQATSRRSEHPAIVEADAYLQAIETVQNVGLCWTVVYESTTDDEIRQMRQCLEQEEGIYEEFKRIKPPDVFLTYHRYIERSQEAYSWDRDSQAAYLDSSRTLQEREALSDRGGHLAGIIDNLQTLSWNALDEAVWNLHESLDLPTEFADGLFRIGTDIAAGVYRRDLEFHDECYWDIHHDDWIEEGTFNYLSPPSAQKQSFTVELAPDDRSFFTIGCGTWKRAFQ